MAVLRDVLDSIMHRRSSTQPDSDLFSVVTSYQKTAAETSAGINPTTYAYPTFNVKRYGAKGDGVTDDGPAIRTAIKAAIQSGGGRIVFPDGATYYVNSLDPASPISIPQQNSNGSTSYASNQVVFYVYHGSNLEFDFQGSTISYGITGGGLGLTFDGCTNIRLIHPTFTGLQVQSTGVASISNLVGGSSYTNGSYINVPMTGGTGGGAYSNIVVSGGAVTTCQIVYAGGGYAVNDTLSCSNTSIGGTGSGFSIKVSSISGVGPVVTTAAPNPLVVLCTDQNSLNISCMSLDVTNCFTAFYVVADPTLPFITSHISLQGNTRVANGEYGVALHNSGDSTVIENLLAFQVNRTFFLYGVQDVDIVAVGNAIAYGFQSVIKAYNRPTSNIRIKYTLENMPGKTTTASSVSIQVQCDPAVVNTPPTVQNVFIDYYERNVSVNGQGIEFDYFAGSGGTAQQTTSSNALFNNIILQGECGNYALTTVQLTTVASYCRINTFNLVQANNAPGANQLVTTNGFIAGLKFSYTPTIQFNGNPSTGWAFTVNAADYYIAAGVCQVFGRLTVNTKGSATGNVTISMPFSPRGDTSRNGMFHGAAQAGMAGLSGPITGFVNTSGLGSLQIQGATGTTQLTDANLTATSDIIWHASFPV